MIFVYRCVKIISGRKFLKKIKKGKWHMKKTISILLAVIMMLSLSTASFAGSSEVEIDKEYTMTIDTYTVSYTHLRAHET